MAKDKSKTKDKTPKAPTNVADDEFAAPGTRSDFKLGEHEGALLLITPLSIERDIETTFGEATATKADIVVLTKNNGKVLEEPIEASGALIFQRVVNGQLEEHVGKRMVLGKIGRGVAKKGQSAPFLIEDPTAEDIEIARAYRRSIDPFAGAAEEKPKKAKK